jgi:hypothetical protein
MKNDGKNGGRSVARSATTGRPRRPSRDGQARRKSEKDVLAGRWVKILMEMRDAGLIAFHPSKP